MPTRHLQPSSERGGHCIHTYIHMPFMFAYTVVCRVKILILGFTYYLVESLEFLLKVIRHADVCMYVCMCTYFS